MTFAKEEAVTTWQGSQLYPAINDDGIRTFCYKDGKRIKEDGAFSRIWESMSYEERSISLYLWTCIKKSIKEQTCLKH